MTHMGATNLHHFKVLSTVLWCRGKLCGRLLRERSSLAACTGALLVKKRVKKKIKLWKCTHHISKPAEICSFCSPDS